MLVAALETTAAAFIESKYLRFSSWHPFPIGVRWSVLKKIKDGGFVENLFSFLASFLCF